MRLRDEMPREQGIRHLPKKLIGHLALPLTLSVIACAISFADDSSIPIASTAKLRAAPEVLGQTAKLGDGTEIEIGSPPLQTDDPGTTDPNHFEINFVSTGTFSRGYKATDNVIDSNYGVNRTIQIKMETHFDSLTTSEQGTEFGTSNVFLGLKWRFLDQDRVHFQLATFPSVELPGSPESIQEGIADPGTTFFLPLLASVQFKSIRVISNIGERFGEGQSSAFYGGVAAATPVSENATLMAEIHEDDFKTAGNSWTSVNLGAKVKLNRSGDQSLLITVGKSIHQPPGESERRVILVGMQWLR